MSHQKEQIVIAGGSGFLGSVLASHLEKAGHRVLILARSPKPNASPRQLYWDGMTVGDWKQSLEGAEAVINLAGRSVDCRYTITNRHLILNSRVNSTRSIGEAIRQCTIPPKVWLNASTATIYRHNLGAAWDERGEIGSAPEAKDVFSVEVAKAWEAAVAESYAAATRKVMMRMAMVLGSARNSVFPVLRRLVRLGFGGRMGTGDQFVSWIHEADYCRAVEWLLSKTIEGPVNIAAPNPVTNSTLMKRLREGCGVPVGLSSPKWLLEFGAFFLRTETELIIKSRRVVPARLVDSGFTFRFPTIEQAVSDLCQAAT